MAGLTNYEKLEKRYAEFVGSRYACTVSSGTAALHLGLLALGVKAGDEVIVPDFTMAACAFAVSYIGAKPIFVDCGDDLNIDVTKIEEKITNKTVAIMAVHIYGRLCNMESICRLANRYALKVIEDACEAQGAVFNSKANLTVYSFYKNKIIHAEEGGIVCTNDQFIHKEVSDLKNMSFGSNHDYNHQRIGYNYRMPDSQAKRVLTSLKHYLKNVSKRKEIESLFKEKISSYLPERKAFWVYDFMVEDQERVFNVLKSKGIEVRYFFKPLSSMPMYRQEIGEKANFYSKRGLILPININMGEKKINNICDIIKNT